MKPEGIVIVTGGAGFIGSHTVDALVAGNRRVVVLDDLSSGRIENLSAHRDNERVTFVEADVSDGLFGPLAHLDEPVDGIIHLAAQVSVARSLERPLNDFRINGQGLVQALEFARLRCVRKMVFASSAAVYGDVERVPTPESAMSTPLSPYGVDKRSGELWMQMYDQVHSLAVSPLRFFNVYGPRQDPRSPYSGVISIFLDRATKHRPLTIFGDGNQTRDFVYVKDVVRAIVAALDSNVTTPPINVGTGTSVTVAQLAQTAIDVCGSSSAIRYEAARQGDIRHSCAVVDRLKEVLQVQAQVSLSDGLKQTAHWYQQTKGSA